MAARSPLHGRAVVVTAGGTREAIDPVRFLGNRSSGKMGTALAAEAQRRGAAVTLITSADAAAPEGVEVVRVESADDMCAAVSAALPGMDVLVMAAAVADYRPREVASRKIKKGASLTLHLVPTVDILQSLREQLRRAGVLVVGFAAETDDREANAARKLAAKGLDLVVLNDVSRTDIGLSSEHNEVVVLGPGGFRAEVSRRPKTDVAAAILDIVGHRLPAAGRG